MRHPRYVHRAISHTRPRSQEHHVPAPGPGQFPSRSRAGGDGRRLDPRVRRTRTPPPRGISPRGGPAPGAGPVQGRQPSPRRAVVCDGLCALGSIAVLAGLARTVDGATAVLALTMVLFPASWVVALRLAHAYDRHVLRTGRGENRRVLVAAAGFLVADVVIGATGNGPSHRLVLPALALAIPVTVARRRSWRWWLSLRGGHGAGWKQAATRRRTHEGPLVARPGRGTPDVAERVLAAVITLCLLPVLVLIAIAVKLAGRGPILVHLPRRDGRGRSVLVLAFRTTRTSASGRPQCAGDAEVSGVGRVLRRLGLDRLPQLFDVVRGRAPLVRSPG
jgi:hypothetical protein